MPPLCKNSIRKRRYIYNGPAPRARQRVASIHRAAESGHPPGLARTPREPLRTRLRACEVEYGALSTEGADMAHDASEDARRLLQAMEELQDDKVGYVMPEDQRLLTHVGLACDIPPPHNDIEQLLEWG